MLWNCLQPCHWTDNRPDSFHAQQINHHLHLLISNVWFRLYVNSKGDPLTPHWPQTPRLGKTATLQPAGSHWPLTPTPPFKYSDAFHTIWPASLLYTPVLTTRSHFQAASLIVIELSLTVVKAKTTAVSKRSLSRERGGEDRRGRRRRRKEWKRKTGITALYCPAPNPPSASHKNMWHLSVAHPTLPVTPTHSGLHKLTHNMETHTFTWVLGAGCLADSMKSALLWGFQALVFYSPASPSSSLSSFRHGSALL